MSRWVFYQPSPTGRNVGDCSVRAVAKALGVDWEKAYLRENPDPYSDPQLTPESIPFFLFFPVRFQHQKTPKP